MRDYFSNGADHQKRNKFSNGPRQVDKREMCFPTSQTKRKKKKKKKKKPQEKGRLIILLISKGRQNKESFQTSTEENNNVVDLATRNVNVPMKYVLLFSLQDYNQKSIVFLKLLLD